MKPLAQMIFVSYLAFAAVGAAMMLQELLKACMRERRVDRLAGAIKGSSPTG